MLKSSTVACRLGSPNCDLPIQLLVVLPRLDGVSVMLALVATGLPLTYSVPVVPDRVTARCVQVFSGSWPAGAVICCSAPPPPVVIAKRTGPPPALAVRKQ